MGIAQSGVTGAFMAQDLALFVVFFDLMLVPFYFLTLVWGGPDRASGGAEALHLHARRLAADARRRDRHRRAGAAPARTARSSFVLSDLAKANLLDRLAALDLPRLRRGVPDQDAVVPVPRLDARRLHADADPGARRLQLDPLQGRGLRLHRDRAAAVPAGRARVPGAADADRARLDPLRVGDGVHGEPGAARPRLLVAGPARLHHARDLRPQRPRGRRRAAAVRQPRARHGRR